MLQDLARLHIRPLAKTALARSTITIITIINIITIIITIITIIIINIIISYDCMNSPHHV